MWWGNPSNWKMRSYIYHICGGPFHKLWNGFERCRNPWQAFPSSLQESASSLIKNTSCWVDSDVGKNLRVLPQDCQPNYPLFSRMIQWFMGFSTTGVWIGKEWTGHSDQRLQAPRSTENIMVLPMFSSRSWHNQCYQQARWQPDNLWSQKRSGHLWWKHVDKHG